MSSISEQFQAFNMTLTESSLRKIIRNVLKEADHKWMPANDSLLMLDQEGIEKFNRESISKFLKAMGLSE